MVLLVKRQMAAAVRGAGSVWRRCPRSSPHVRDLSRWRKQNPAAERPNRRTEIDVLHIEEVALIQQTHGFSVIAVHQQAGGAEPVHVLLPSRDPLHEVRDRWHTPAMQRQQRLLTKFRK